MIVTKQKPIEDILRVVQNEKGIFVVGCADCATSCSTGGEKEVQAMAQTLQEHGHKITGTFAIDVPCDERMDKIFFRKFKEKLSQSTAILVLACGAGINAIAKNTDLKVYSGLDSLFVGTTERLGNFNEYCSLCGDCILNETEAICPVTRCPKGFVNGPCGGAINGNCEVYPDKQCLWVSIYEKNNNAPVFSKMIPYRKNRKLNQPQTIRKTK